MPNIRMAVVTTSAMDTQRDTLRKRAQGLRAMIGVEPSLSRQLGSDASEHEQVADALLSLINYTDLIVVQP